MIRAITRAATAAAGLILLLAGMPLVLALTTTTLDLSLPSWSGGEAPLIEQLSAWLSHSWHGLRLRLGRAGLLALMMLGIGWLIWAVLTYWTVVAALSRLRSGAHLAHGHLSAIPPRRWIAGLVTTAVMVTGPTAAATTTPSTSPVATAPRQPGPRVDTAHPLTSGGHPDPSTPEQSVEETASEFTHHRVRRGDTLWDLAATYLDDSTRWRELFTLNAHRPQPDGLMLADPDILLPGWHLRIPAPAEHIAPQSPAPQHTSPLEPPTTALPPETVPDSSIVTTPETKPDSEEGIDLGTGVYLGLGLAAATGTVLTIARTRHRRRHRPDEPPSPNLPLGPSVYPLRLEHPSVQVERVEPPQSEPSPDTPVAEPEPEPEPETHEDSTIDQAEQPDTESTCAPTTADGANTPQRPETSEQTPAAALLSLQVFGPMQLTWAPTPEAGAHDLTPALTPRHRELLTYLALHPDGVSRDALVADLWHDAPLARPTNALNTTLSRLRTALSRATGSAVTNLCEATDARMNLHPGLVDVDYRRFHAAEHTSRHATEASERMAALRALVAEYHGELGADIDAEWIQTPRHAAQRSLVNAVSTLARHLIDDEPHGTLDLLETAREADPYNENLYRDIMRLQDRLGMHDGITRTLALLETRLTEIGLESEPETRELATGLQRRHSRALATEST